MIVQIYEIQRPEEAEAIIEDGVDHIGGVVLSSREWKDPHLFETVQLVKAADRISSLIPLFSDLDAIRRVLDYYRPDILHLCEILPGAPSDRSGCADQLAIQKAIHKAYPAIKIMRSIPIGRPGQADADATLALAAAFEPFSDYFLTDTLLPPEGTSSGAQPVDGFVGITGKTCDWQVARALVDQVRIPVILAGGLSPENVQTAIATVGPAGVDSCTATNQFDTEGRAIRFQKDRERVRAFVRAARRRG